MDLIVCWILRGALFLLNLLPLTFQIRLTTFLVRLFVSSQPRYKRIALKNIHQVFPELDASLQNDLFCSSLTELARLVVDSSRLSRLNQEWVRKNVKCDFLGQFAELKSQQDKGILIATGHLGSFELLAHSIAMLGFPISFVVRNFTLPAVDRWWKGIRERGGNRVINRDGAVRELLKTINSGGDAALLFDQNVKRNHAIFVEHFGRPAATTRTLGTVAVRTGAPVVVASVRYGKERGYEIIAEECFVKDIYEDESLSFDEKCQRVTERATVIFEKMIRAYPAGWFWLHRRWKTAPEGLAEDFYKK